MASFKLTAQEQVNRTSAKAVGYFESRIYVDPAVRFLATGEEEFLSVLLAPGNGREAVSVRLNEADAKKLQDAIFTGRQAMEKARKQRSGITNQRLESETEEAW